MQSASGPQCLPPHKRAAGPSRTSHRAPVQRPEPEMPAPCGFRHQPALMEHGNAEFAAARTSRMKTVGSTLQNLQGSDGLEGASGASPSSPEAPSPAQACAVGCTRTLHMPSPSPETLQDGPGPQSHPSCHLSAWDPLSRHLDPAPR